MSGVREKIGSPKFGFLDFWIFAVFPAQTYAKHVGNHEASGQHYMSLTFGGGAPKRRVGCTSDYLHHFEYVRAVIGCQ